MKMVYVCAGYLHEWWFFLLKSKEKLELGNEIASKKKYASVHKQMKEWPFVHRC